MKAKSSNALPCSTMLNSCFYLNGPKHAVQFATQLTYLNHKTSTTIYMYCMMVH